MGIKKNDTVLVVAGDEKGKKGRVLTVDVAKNRVVVESVNIIKKHMKPSKQYSQGGIIEKEAPIQRSKVMLLCPKCSQPTRVGNKVLENGKKTRACRKCGEVVD
ncbi:MAG: 50S ribosomal protein L24 [Nitrospiraceae bacterium]|nr:MAG: 50S ribosomal protein L24 [Nitrospiraceae bacterium]